MTVFDHIDQMARGGSMALFALWSWLLWRDHRDVLAARMAIILNACIICYLLITAGWEGWSVHQGPFQLLLTMGAGATPGMFWLFTRAWFNDEARVSKIGVALVVLSVVNVTLLQMTFESKPPIFYFSAVTFRIGMLAFAAAGLWEAWRGREGDLIESRRRIRPRIVLAVGGYVILIAIAEMISYNDLGPPWVIRIVASSIVFITIAFCAAMFAMRQSELFGAPSRKPRNDRLPAPGK
jgi:hypothetical protein